MDGEVGFGGLFISIRVLELHREGESIVTAPLCFLATLSDVDYLGSTGLGCVASDGHSRCCREPMLSVGC